MDTCCYKVWLVTALCSGCVVLLCYPLHAALEYSAISCYGQSTIACNWPEVTFQLEEMPLCSLRPPCSSNKNDYVL
jgi:hypothetical protein